MTDFQHATLTTCPNCGQQFCPEEGDCPYCGGWVENWDWAEYEVPEDEK
jgi:uncharacterized OB-fold protein